MTTTAKQHRIRNGSIELAVTEYAGTGPAILLIHGIGSGGLGWANIIPRLSQDFTPLTLDLRGHGESDHPDHGYLYDDYIGDLDAVLDELGMERPSIVGHSLGGIIALWWAARYPDRAAGLMIEDSPLRSGTDFRSAFEGWLEYNALTENQAAARYRAENPHWPDDLVKLRAHQITSTARGVFTELYADSMAHHGIDRIAEITAIESPVLLIHGDLETGGMVHPDDATALRHRLANVETARLAGANHRIHAEREDDFLDLAIPFLRNNR